MELTNEKIIEITQRSIDKKEQAFESLRNRMYWMLTIASIILVPLVSIEKFKNIDIGWIIFIGIIGLLFLSIISFFYYWFVRPRWLPEENIGEVFLQNKKREKLAEEYLDHLSNTDSSWKNVIKELRRKFFRIMIALFLVIFGVIIFISIGGSF